MGKAALIILLPLALMPLRAEGPGINHERRFSASTNSGRAVSFWIHSRADLELVSLAASAVDSAQAPLFMPSRTAPDAAFLSARALPLLGERDREELRTLAEQGVPIACECGEHT